MKLQGMFRVAEESCGERKEKIKMIREKLLEAEAVVIGAGAGLSTAAGLTYSGERFENLFGDFIRKYHMTDMYSAGFYPFLTEEEKWAYWSRHIFYNRYGQPAGKAYLDLFKLMQGKNYFVITTNVDYQFYLAGFEPERIFAVQGDYGKFQCAKACHEKLYDNESQVRAMVREQKGCRIPGGLVPQCPVCKGRMEVNLRCDQYFVEDEAWHLASDRYKRFLEENREKKTVFLELGVGFNTPGIIKYPFWQMTAGRENSEYICINQGQAWAPENLTVQDLRGSVISGSGGGQAGKSLADRTVCLNTDLANALSELLENTEQTLYSKAF